ncbi:MAG: hypothetical protein QM759_05145 [Terricaulis sp.]
MLKCDAIWLQQALARFSSEELSPIVNIGSSTKHFRTVEQPFIDELIFAPLAARGVKVIHVDLKAGDGVDISTDIFNNAGLEEVRKHAPKSVICTHMFEHVVSREDLAARLMALLPMNGLFFITVPSSYHQHNDPIDTMFRPTPEELAALFPGQQIMEKQSLAGDSYWMHVRKRPVTLFFRHFFRFFVPFLGWQKWKRSMGKLYWLYNPYRVSAIAGRKMAEAPTVRAKSVVEAV